MTGRALRAKLWDSHGVADRGNGNAVLHIDLNRCTRYRARSCPDGRLENLRAAAAVVRWHRVAAGVVAIVVPDSTATKRAAKAERLDHILNAGFEWRHSGCMSVAMNDDRLAPGKRCASTSNRIFRRAGGRRRAHSIDERGDGGDGRDRRQPGRRARGGRGVTLFTRLEGFAAPPTEWNVGADIIYPARFMLITAREGLRAGAFHDRRQGDPGFVLNRSPVDEACDLIAAANFGSGSNREQAVWALRRLRIRCVVAPSVGEIFQANCYRSGMRLIVLPHKRGVELAVTAGRERRFAIDLDAQTIAVGDGPPLAFAIPAGQRLALLNGWDDTATIINKRGGDITALEARQRAEQPWLREAA